MVLEFFPMVAQLSHDDIENGGMAEFVDEIHDPPYDVLIVKDRRQHRSGVVVTHNVVSATMR